MTYQQRAPKQRCLEKNETIGSYERWQRNLLYILSLDPNQKIFTKPGATWERRKRNNPKRGFTDDGDNVTTNKRTAEEKVQQLELMLGQIANYCGVIDDDTIINGSTSLDSIWKAIRTHYGFQCTGARFIDLAEIKRQPEERPADLYQRINSFISDCLLRKDGGITHHDEAVDEDEFKTPTLENFMILYWLQLVHPDLPKQVKLRFTTQLRTRTLASLKDEISLSLDSLMDEIGNVHDARTMRAGVEQMFKRKPYAGGSKAPYGKSTRTRTPYNDRQRFSSRQEKECSICLRSGDPCSHLLSQCPHLTENDSKFMSRLRALDINDDDECQSDYESDASARHISTHYNRTFPKARRVPVEESPYLDVYFQSKPVRITVDSGATGNFISKSAARRLGVQIRKNSQGATQADGKSEMKIVGETSFEVSRDSHTLRVDALVAEEMNDEILGGTPFQRVNDVSPRISAKVVYVGSQKYPYMSQTDARSHNRRIHIDILKADENQTVWPDEYIECRLPTSLPDNEYAIEPRLSSAATVISMPMVTQSVGGTVRLVNNSCEPVTLKKNQEVCQLRPMCSPDTQAGIKSHSTNPSKSVQSHQQAPFSASVRIDPDNRMPVSTKAKFAEQLIKYDDTFNPQLGKYNGESGPIKAVVHMGPVLPPQRKGRMPLYGRSNLEQLQAEQDYLEEQGALVRPEDLGIHVEYLNPSFLVKKPKGGFRLVTAFTDIAQFSKPQPSLMPNIDNTLRQIGQWKYIVEADLTKAFHQIPLDRGSMPFCGIATPFKGIRVYTRAAMGMPGSETALEEVMCRVLGDLVYKGHVAKIADNLFVGANTYDELFDRWEEVLSALSRNGLRLSSSQTCVAPASTIILGWKWEHGTLSANSHRISPLSRCEVPKTVKQLRSFIGAYQVLARVIPRCTQYLGPLDDITAGKKSADKLSWSDEQLSVFQQAKDALSTATTINTPQPSDQLWIVTDGAMRVPGIASTLFIVREGKPLVAEFFSAKVSLNQRDWLPCEIEALAISSSITHFSPYLIQSIHHGCALTDSKPCVQAYEKLKRGEFSVSPRLSTFLSTVSRYQVSIRHIRGVNNPLSDFGSRNPGECCEEKCQVCSFVKESEECVVRAISLRDLLQGKGKLPFTSRSAWITTQRECPDLRKTYAYLKQGTRPSKKLTNIRDVKRYLQSKAHIAGDGLLIVKSTQPFNNGERVIIPRSVVRGLLSALHIKLDHPLTAQLKTVCDRYLFALDIGKVITEVTSACDVCVSLSSAPNVVLEQSTSIPPEVIGARFAVDVLRRNCQIIFVSREHVTSFTNTCILNSEQKDSLREGIIKTCIELRSLDGPPAVVRVDGASGLKGLVDDELLRKCNMVVDIGNPKNKNKNPIAERAVEELEEELRKHQPGGGTVSASMLAMVTASLNCKVRKRGLSSREMITTRDQFTNNQLPISDQELILKQYESKVDNHRSSEMSKAPGRSVRPTDSSIGVGDVVYLYSERDKHSSREKYLVTSIDGEWCFVRKFVGNQLRNMAYKVRKNELYKVADFRAEPRLAYEDDNVHSESQSYEDDDAAQLQSFSSFSKSSRDNDASSAMSSPRLSQSSYDEKMPEEATDLPPIPAAIGGDLDYPEDTCDNSGTAPEQESSAVSRPKRQCRKPDRLQISWT